MKTFTRGGAKQIGLSVVALLLSILITPRFAALQDQACPPSGDNLPAINLTVNNADDTYQGAAVMLPDVLAYLNGGGSGADVLIALTHAAINAEEGIWQFRTFSENVIEPDEPALIIELALTGGDQIDHFIDGAVFVVNCQGGAYVAAPPIEIRGYRGGDWLGEESGILAFEDLTGDGQPEIIITTISNIAMHGYATRAYAVWGWQNEASAFEQLLADIPQTFNASLNLEDENGDGTLDLLLTEPQFRHHNYTEWSRLNRGDQTVWQWTGTQMDAVCARAATPATFRIQLFEDGANAIACDDFQLALETYQRVLDDESLAEWTEADDQCPGCDPVTEAADLEVRRQVVVSMGTPVPNPDERLRLNAYALYRLTLVDAAQGENAAAEATAQQIQADYPGHTYAELTEFFWANFTDDVTAACAEVETYAAAEAITAPIEDYNYFGYSILEEDICPF